jgi:hypothetical protein
MNASSFKGGPMTLHATRVKIALVAAVMSVSVMSGRSATAQSNPYRLVENWETEELVGAEAVAIDHNGNIFAAQRCQLSLPGNCLNSTRPPIVELDPSGKVIRAFGVGMFVFIHGLYVDKDNNLWATDAKEYKGKGQQVFKFSPEGKVLLTLGTAGVAGDGPDTFHTPNSVVVAANGDIFVEDGHGLDDGYGADSNYRIVQFSKDGKFIKSWGKKGSAPGEFGEFHGLATDSQGRLFVCDRGNARIQVFSQNGELLAVWNQFGACDGIFVDANDTIYASSRNSPGRGAGIQIGSAKDGIVKYFIPADRFMPVGVAVDAMGNLYAGDAKTWRVEKYVKK